MRSEQSIFAQDGLDHLSRRPAAARRQRSGNCSACRPYLLLVANAELNPQLQGERGPPILFRKPSSKPSAISTAFRAARRRSCWPGSSKSCCITSSTPAVAFCSRKNASSTGNDPSMAMAMTMTPGNGQRICRATSILPAQAIAREEVETLKPHPGPASRKLSAGHSLAAAQRQVVCRHRSGNAVYRRIAQAVGPPLIGCGRKSQVPKNP